eukprot:14891118-Heterocapsa_arctica.AAC.1
MMLSIRRGAQPPQLGNQDASANVQTVALTWPTHWIVAQSRLLRDIHGRAGATAHNNEAYTNARHTVFGSAPRVSK